MTTAGAANLHVGAQAGRQRCMVLGFGFLCVDSSFLTAVSPLPH